MKHLKITLFLLVSTLCAVSPALATVEMSSVATFAKQNDNAPALQALTPEMAQLSIDQFLTLTPAKYKEMTGERLGIKKSLQLKAAQKFIKAKRAGDPDIPKGLFIVLAILGWAWIVMGLMDDWKGNDWWVNLILVLLCWLPGVIHALVKMKKYYN
jgi:uncharacterized membrane protein YqaE (UPF0057 family)